MAFSLLAAGGVFAEVNQKGASTTCVGTVLSSGQVAVGKLVVVCIATDNSTSTAGDSTEISVTDSKGNTYTRAKEQTQGGSAASTATAGIFYSVITTALVTGDTITASFSSRTATLMFAWGFSFGAGNTISVAATAGSGGSGAIGSLPFSGATSGQEYLAFAVDAIETNVTTGSWNGFEGTGTGIQTLNDATSGGGSASNMHISAAHVIRTVSSTTPSWGAGSMPTGDYRAVGVLFLEQSSGPTLAPADSAFASTIENVDLVQQNTLVVQDAAFASTIENVALTQQNVLVVQDQALATTAENATLEPALAPADLAFASTAENVTLGLTLSLTVQDQALAASAENVDLVQQNTLVVQDQALATSTENATLEPILVPNDVAVAFAIESPSLVQQNVLAVADQAIALAIESPSLVQQNVLAIADEAIASSIDNVDLVQQNTLAVADESVASSIESPTLGVFYSLAVADEAVALSIDNVDLVQQNSLVIANEAIASTIESPSLTQQNVLAVADESVALAIESPSLTQQNVLVVDDVAVAFGIENVTLGASDLLIPNDVAVAFAIQNVTLLAELARVADLAAEIATDANSVGRTSAVATEILIQNVPITFARVADLAVEVAHWSQVEHARVADLAVEVMILEGVPPWTGVTPEILIEDCTIQGVINSAMIQSGINYRQVTTRGAFGVEIVRHRALLLQRCISIWEGIEVRDLSAATAATVSCGDVSEIVTVEAHRVLDGAWVPVMLVSHRDPDYVGLGVVIRDNVAELQGWPGEWAGYDQIKFVGPPIGLVPDDYAGDLAPNDQVAPLFCRALKVHAQGYLEIKAGNISAATETRREYVEVVAELLAQARSQRDIMVRRFGVND